MSISRAKQGGVVSNDVQYRQGRAEDAYAVFLIFEKTLVHLFQSLRSGQPARAEDPELLERTWQDREALYNHLFKTAEHFWVAERDGEVVGYARSVLRNGLMELTEFFVLPGSQASGVGKELLRRVFPQDERLRRSIIATADVRAQARYLKAGVYPRFPMYNFGRQPEQVRVETDLVFEPLTDSAEHQAAVARIEKEILGYSRPEDHAWLLADREGWLYQRDGEVAGYGYAGRRNGPFALLDPADFPAVLAYAERRAWKQGREDFRLEVPTINRHALDYLIGRGFRMDSFITLIMSDEPFGRFENYIVTDPPFFL